MQCNNVAFQILITFPSVAGQDKPHSISAGIKPLSSAADAKFKEMAPNLLLHSKKPPKKVKMQGLPLETRTGIKKWGWSMVIGLQPRFFLPEIFSD